jgi:hypothetical protein
MKNAKKALEKKTQPGTILNRSQQMRQLIRPSVLILSCLILAACSSTRSLKPGQVLYTGADIVINPDSSVKIDNQKSVKSTLEEKTRPRPNKSILGFKFKLFMYNLAGEPKKPKGIRHWLRTKVGEPPVLLSEVKLQASTQSDGFSGQGWTSQTGWNVVRCREGV